VDVSCSHGPSTSRRLAARTGDGSGVFDSTPLHRRFRLRGKDAAAPPLLRAAEEDCAGSTRPDRCRQRLNLDPLSSSENWPPAAGARGVVPCRRSQPGRIEPAGRKGLISVEDWAEIRRLHKSQGKGIMAIARHRQDPHLDRARDQGLPGRPSRALCHRRPVGGPARPGPRPRRARAGASPARTLPAARHRT
jgi:hypothetical protein